MLLSALKVAIVAALALAGIVGQLALLASGTHQQEPQPEAEAGEAEGGRTTVAACSIMICDVS